jgi:hypothetical protein
MNSDNPPRDATGRVAYDSESTVPVNAVDAPRHEAFDRGDVVARERERFGGMKFGSAFFGWLTALGTIVLLTAIVGAVGVALGLETGTTVDEAAGAAADSIQSVGWLGAIAIAVALFLSYLAGGYVAGRMARFSGALQGLAVWLWGVLIAVVVAVVSLLAGNQWDILSTLDSFPRIPLTAEALTTSGIVTAIVAAVITLGGAVLGGLAGMRSHRAVDRVGLGEVGETRASQ